MGFSRPPRLPRAALRLLLPPSLADEVVETLDVRYQRRLREHSRLRAAGWYWVQALRTVPPALGRRLGRRSAAGGAGGGWTLDLADALRRVRRAPASTAVVVLTLALGIGPTTAVLTLVEQTLLQPLPYSDADELVVVTDGGTPGSPRFLSGPDVADLRERASTLAAVAAVHEPLVAPMTGVERPLHVRMQEGSWNLLDVLDVEPALGRRFTPADLTAAAGDDGGTAPRPVLLGHGLWQRAFGGDPGVLGRGLSLWGSPYVVVGVMPRGFRLLLPPDMGIGGSIDVLAPAGATYPDWAPTYRELRVVGRLGDGASVQAASREVEAISAGARERRVVNRDLEVRFRAAPLPGAVREPIRATLTAFSVAVLLVLLITCANVANLLLARGTARGPELAVRAALGAGRGRIVRQLLLESAVLALLGAAVGAALAWTAVSGLGHLAPPALLQVGEIRPDASMLAFAGAAGVVAAVAAGLYPALRLAADAPADALRSRGGVGGDGRLLATFTVIQVALSMALLGSAGLMVRSLAELQRVPLGFEPAGVLTATVTQTLRPEAERRETEEALLREVRAVPGVESAGIVFPLPLNGVYERSARYVAEERLGDPAAWRGAYFRTISPGYLETVGLRLLSGRGLGRGDVDGEVPVAIVGARAAAALWPGQDPLGRSIRVAGMGEDTVRFEVVGVVEHAPQRDLRDRTPTLYFPRAFYRSHEVSLTVRTAGRAAVFAEPLRAAVRRAAPDLPVEVGPMTELVERSLGPTRFILTLLGVFAGVAVVVTAVGLYGVLSFRVRRQTREIGVRLALGATVPSLSRAVVARGLRLSLTGVAPGLVGALVLGRLLEGHLFGVGAADPVTLGATAVLVLAVAVAASWLPGRRAASVHPVEALSRD